MIIIHSLNLCYINLGELIIALLFHSFSVDLKKDLDNCGACAFHNPLANCRNIKHAKATSCHNGKCTGKQAPPTLLPQTRASI